MLPSAIQLEYATFVLRVALGAMFAAPKTILKAPPRQAAPNA